MDTKSTTYSVIEVSEFGNEDAMKVVEKSTGHPGLSPKQVRVIIRAAGVNPVDTYIRSGNYGALPTLPYTPGRDGAGEIVEVGSEVKKVSVGDRVYLQGPNSGTYAQYCICSQDNVQPLPQCVSFAQGACVTIPYYTAYRALFIRGGAKQGDTVLVHGASGAVGLACVQLCKQHGMRIIGTSSTAQGRAKIIAFGGSGTLAFNHRQEGYMADIKAATEGRGVDLIIEMLANVNLEADMGLMALHGRIMVVGNRGTITVNPRGLMVRESDVRGVALAHTSPAEFKTMHAAIQEGLRSQALQPLVVGRHVLGNAPAAHRAVLASGRVGNVVILPWDPGAAL